MSAELVVLRERIDTFGLSKKINHKLERIWRLAHYRFQPSKVPKGSYACTDGLSPVGQETLKGISEIFGKKVYVKNSKGGTRYCRSWLGPSMTDDSLLVWLQITRGYPHFTLMS